MNSVSREYPRTVSYNDAKVELSLLSAADTEALKAFIATLPEHDLLYLDRDVTHPKVVEAWVKAVPKGQIKSIVARENGVIVGCTALVLRELSWSRHVGELRVLVSPTLRGKGLGRLLIQECFIQALELGLSKLCVQMTVDQRAAIAGFESIGFRAEAVFRNHVKDREGKLHDLAVLSHDINEVQARQEAYGIADALGA
ncbi:MAG: N-acetyltransferase family protein [Gammaproteobacteria bacterium]